MTQCECLPKCPFFHNKMANRPATSEFMKKKYCLSDNSKCARYMVFKNLGRSNVPTDLFPMQIDRAEELISA